MKLIHRNQMIFDMWGRQFHNKSFEYKLIKYIRYIKVEDNTMVVIENFMTREVILITIEELNSILNGTIKEFNYTLYLYLISNWWLIPVNMDERSMIYTYRNKLRPNKLFGRYINQYVIVTTTACNARCPYCYEAGTPSKTMTKQTAIDVARYIMKKRDKNGKVNIRWFGGEPLCNMEAIDVISNELSKNNVEYYSSMISNGYLLNEDIAKKANELWHMSSVQITLDGTAEPYKHIKNYKNNDSDPFSTVIKNIRYLLNNSIKLAIRMNLTLENKDNLYELVDYLYDTFKDISNGENIVVYPIPIFEGDNTGFVQRSDEERSKVYDELFKLEDYIENTTNMPMKQIIAFNHVATTQCMADKPDSILISPEGNLGKCEHHVDDSFYGSIYGHRLDKKYQEIRKFKQPITEVPECVDCFYYPMCNKIDMCPVERICNDSVRKVKERMVDKSLLDIYLKYKNGDSQ